MTCGLIGDWVSGAFITIVDVFSLYLMSLSSECVHEKELRLIIKVLGYTCLMRYSEVNCLWHKT